MNIRIFCTIIITPILLINSCSTPEKKPNIILAICDDMSFGHTSFDGCTGITTPNIDFLASNGVYFENAYCSSPSCSPSRASILTGQNGYELEQGAVLWGYLPSKFKTYTDILEESGYFVGFTGKGWGPGDLEIADRKRNPAGNAFNAVRNLPFQELGNKGEINDTDYVANFQDFLSKKPKDTPFCFWYGAFEPHRVYAEGIAEQAGKDLSTIDVPDFLIDNEITRADILDYYFEIEWFDTQLGRIIDQLKEIGELENTIILVTSDNGMPFPRAKANLYEYGIHMPLIAYWPSKIKKPKKVDDFISLADIAPTLLQAAGIDVPVEMSAKSFLDVILSPKSGSIKEENNFVVSYRERHAWVNPNGEMAPMRSIRHGDFLLIWNMKPQMWPAGHIQPKYNWNNYPFGDVDNGRSKNEMMKLINTNEKYLFDLSFSPRQEYELYNVKEDPYNLNNLVNNNEYQETMENLKNKMIDYLIKTGDPRMKGPYTKVFLNTPYYAMQGIPTGGLFLKEWNTLDSVGKMEAIKTQYQAIDDNKKKLENMGWDLSILEDLD